MCLCILKFSSAESTNSIKYFKQLKQTSSHNLHMYMKDSYLPLTSLLYKYIKSYTIILIPKRFANHELDKVQTHANYKQNTPLHTCLLE